MAMAMGQVLVFLLRTSSANNNTMETAYTMDIFCFPFVKMFFVSLQAYCSRKNPICKYSTLPKFEGHSDKKLV